MACMWLAVAAGLVRDSPRDLSGSAFNSDVARSIVMEDGDGLPFWGDDAKSLKSTLSSEEPNGLVGAGQGGFSDEEVVVAGSDAPGLTQDMLDQLNQGQASSDPMDRWNVDPVALWNHGRTSDHAAVASPPAAVMERVCEHETLRLSCDSGVISVLGASYGRVHGPEVCPHKQTSDRSCHADTSENVVVAACEGKPSCEVAAENAVFGDPCVNTFKYLSVDYACVEADGPSETRDSGGKPAVRTESTQPSFFSTSAQGFFSDAVHSGFHSPAAYGKPTPSMEKRVCEHKALSLSCKTGVINIVDASYGRKHGREVCKALDKHMRDRNCHAASSVKVVRTVCEGKASCKVWAENKVFGDPCINTFKYLTVNYACVEPSRESPSPSKPAVRTESTQPSFFSTSAQGFFSDAVHSGFHSPAAYGKPTPSSTPLAACEADKWYEWDAAKKVCMEIIDMEAHTFRPAERRCCPVAQCDALAGPFEVHGPEDAEQCRGPGGAVSIACCKCAAGEPYQWDKPASLLAITDRGQSQPVQRDFSREEFGRCRTDINRNDVGDRFRKDECCALPAGVKRSSEVATSPTNPEPEPEPKRCEATRDDPDDGRQTITQEGVCVAAAACTQRSANLPQVASACAGENVCCVLKEWKTKDPRQTMIFTTAGGKIGKSPFLPVLNGKKVGMVFN